MGYRHSGGCAVTDDEALSLRHTVLLEIDDIAQDARSARNTGTRETSIGPWLRNAKAKIEQHVDTLRNAGRTKDQINAEKVALSRSLVGRAKNGVGTAITIYNAAARHLEAMDLPTGRRPPI
jgi:hypothetical protein